MALDTTIGGASSDSYATLAEYQAYAAKYGWTLSGTDAADEVNLRLGLRYLDNSYTWLGEQASDTQALDWPRVIGFDRSSFLYLADSDEIPAKIKEAQMEMAYAIQGGADPYATISGGAVKRKREKVDVIEEETEYFEGSGVDRDSYPIVDQLVSAYVVGKAGGKVFSVALQRG